MGVKIVTDSASDLPSHNSQVEYSSPLAIVVWTTEAGPCQ